MIFSEQTFEALSAYETQYRTAINGDWCSNPGRAALALMHAELERIDKRQSRMNYNCSTCVLTTVKRIGRLYFADKAEREAKLAAEAAGEVAAAPEASQPDKTPAKSNKAKTRKK